jgi:dihydroflavonol-4-reductase
MGLNVEVVEGDVLDRESLASLITGAETVFNLAGKISIAGENRALVEGINCRGTENVVDVCLEAGVKRLVHFSTIHAFSSNPTNETVTEERALVDGEHKAVYDTSKAEGQRIVLKGVKRGLNAVIVNPTAVIGPNDFKISRMGEVLLDLYHNRYPLLIDGGYNWVDVRDVVSGALAAEKRGRSGECYLLSGHRVHLQEFAALIGRLTGRKTPSGAIPLWLASAVAAFNLAYGHISGKTPKLTPEAIKAIRTHQHISHQKATEELGYSPRPFEETVRDSIAWFQEAGLLEER